MPATYKILIMGASYGSLLASKILYGGHSVHLVCLPAEADLINAEGFRGRLPVKGRKDQVEIDSRKLPGKVTAGGAAGVHPKDYDLVGLAMQEPGPPAAPVIKMTLFTADIVVDATAGTPPRSAAGSSTAMPPATLT